MNVSKLERTKSCVVSVERSDAVAAVCDRRWLRLHDAHRAPLHCFAFRCSAALNSILDESPVAACHAADKEFSSHR